jgi:hypothetical protein
LEVNPKPVVIDQSFANSRVYAGGIIARQRQTIDDRESVMLPPNAGKYRALIPAIAFVDRAPALFRLRDADGAGACFNGDKRLRTTGVRMPRMRSRGGQRHRV